MRFNKLLGSHFAGCLVLARARDVYRNRDVTVHMIPGDFSIVGVSDGVEAWIAPVVVNPFSVNVKKLLEDVQAGKPLTAPEPLLRRRPPPVATTPPPPLLKRRGEPISPVAEATKPAPQLMRRR